MHDYESAALAASVRRAYACTVRVADVTSVYLLDTAVGRHGRVVVTYELDGPQPARVCFAWNEPNANDQPRLVLRSPDIRTPQEAVRAVLRGWINGIPARARTWQPLSDRSITGG